MVESTFFRYVAPIALLVGAMHWIQTDYSRLDNAGSDMAVQSSTCQGKLGSSESACPTVVAATLNNVDDDKQNEVQRTHPTGVASTMQFAFSSEVERNGTLGRDTQPDIEGANVASGRDFNGIDEGFSFNDEEPQYIGEFIDPDAEDFGSETLDNTPVSIGEFIDPDDILAYTTNGVEQTIGAFIDPDAGELLVDGEGQARNVE